MGDVGGSSPQHFSAGDVMSNLITVLSSCACWYCNVIISSSASLLFWVLMLVTCKCQPVSEFTPSSLNW
ncbi:hypothetical protein DAPPUDRAFT_328114 [Daphnia pulex]|uniref:Uncharacterized protein n=1 Tax=Daphnia pulex TaxID=6669 RepID=E9HCZ3_DAPPU|nr:hypothetical protein DAPPUDRAFT_337189 [Daphnia pulex]EFX70388.1 hypothetical protein DAPPUDRAFT_328114 [Daphnia pulex]|eukprot:EFX62264.1 hypothetical protein DAPPUDRAFT_337189 [Daphnia pulex]